MSAAGPPQATRSLLGGAQRRLAGEHAIATAPSLLEVRDLCVRFSDRAGSVIAVNGVSFDLAPGETVALVGESGCGKSTIGLALMGLTGARHVAGTVDLAFKSGERRDLTRLSDRAMQEVRGNEVAMIFQEPMSSLNPVHTIGWQIREAITRHQGATRAIADDAALGLLNQLGIADAERCMRSYPHQLSGGMRQRVMIAIALSCRPSLLIADEPTTALDVTVQAQILELLKRVQAETGMAILFITHNFGVVAEIAQRTMVMYAGRIVEAGAAGDVYHSPRMPYTRALLESLPHLGRVPEGARLPAIPGQVPNPAALPPGCAFHPRCRYAVPGRCDRQDPPLEKSVDHRIVRCLRWSEIATAGEP
jgi:oligopeptide/dipeptide ABC transporter ATP-binding protein